MERDALFQLIYIEDQLRISNVKWNESKNYLHCQKEIFHLSYIVKYLKSFLYIFGRKQSRQWKNQTPTHPPLQPPSSFQFRHWWHGIFAYLFFLRKLIISTCIDKTVPPSNSISGGRTEDYITVDETESAHQPMYSPCTANKIVI